MLAGGTGTFARVRNRLPCFAPVSRAVEPADEVAVEFRCTGMGWVGQGHIVSYAYPLDGIRPEKGDRFPSADRLAEHTLYRYVIPLCLGHLGRPAVCPAGGGRRRADQAVFSFSGEKGEDGCRGPRVRAGHARGVSPSSAPGPPGRRPGSLPAGRGKAVP